MSLDGVLDGITKITIVGLQVANLIRSMRNAVSISDNHATLTAQVQAVNDKLGDSTVPGVPSPPTASSTQVTLHEGTPP